MWHALASQTLQWLAGTAPPQYAEVGPYTFASSEVRYNMRYDPQWNQVRGAGQRASWEAAARPRGEREQRPGQLASTPLPLQRAARRCSPALWVQVQYTYHTFETFDPALSCPTCILDDPLLVINRGYQQFYAAMRRMSAMLAASTDDLALPEDQVGACLCVERGEEGGSHQAHGGVGWARSCSQPVMGGAAATHLPCLAPVPKQKQVKVMLMPLTLLDVFGRLIGAAGALGSSDPQADALSQWARCGLLRTLSGDTQFFLPTDPDDTAGIPYAPELCRFISVTLQAAGSLPDPVPPTDFAALGYELDLAAAGAWVTAAVGSSSPE